MSRLHAHTHTLAADRGRRTQSNGECARARSPLIRPLVRSTLSATCPAHTSGKRKRKKSSAVCWPAGRPEQPACLGRGAPLLRATGGFWAGQVRALFFSLSLSLAPSRHFFLVTSNEGQRVAFSGALLLRQLTNGGRPGGPSSQLVGEPASKRASERASQRARLERTARTSSESGRK